MLAETAKRRYAKKSYRTRASSSSVLAAMLADKKRGQRIKTLRLGETAKDPDPARADKPKLGQQFVADQVPVSLRAYQRWEEGGGLEYENAKALAKVFGVTAGYVLNGPQQTPDMLASLNGIPPALQKQLDHITELLENLAEVNRELLVPYLSKTPQKKRAERQRGRTGSTTRQQPRSAKRKAA